MTLHTEVALPTDEDRRLLRDSLRGFLQSHWPAEEAVARHSRPDQVAQLWQGLGDQGLLSLGSDATEGGVREMVVVMEELGRAAAPIPFLGLAVVPMSSPGITVKPSSTMYDGTFANIFYDDVWVPEDALIGPENGGWKVLTDALANERGMVGGGIVLKVVHAFEQLCEDLADVPALLSDPRVRDQVGQFAAEIEVGRQLMMRCALLAESGTTPPEMGALSKIYSGELFERFGQWALEVLGPRALRSQEAPDALRHGRYEQGLRHSLRWVISIGTNEIQRSLMAQRGLGLPR